MRHELAYLVGQTNTDELEDMLKKVSAVLPKKCSELLRRAAMDPEAVSPKLLKSLKKTLHPFRRYGPLTEIFTYCWRRCAAIIGRITGSSGKKLSSGGGMFAVVGADGAGKTTVVREMMTKFGQKIRVKSYYLGSGRYTFRTRVIWVFFAPTVVISKLLPSCRMLLFIRSLFCGLLEYSFALDRFQRYRRGWRHAANGTVVVFERFPIADVIDHPSVNAWDEGWSQHRVMLWLGARIGRIYDKFKQPQRFLYLRIDPLEAVKRKPNDHRLEVIAPKQDRLSRFARGNRGVLEIDAMAPLEGVVAKILDGIWTSL